ncbi:hypothetical protein MASR2M15_26030 [Anaerolineales bacterium]
MIRIITPDSGTSFRQRWANYFVIIAILGAVFVSLILKNNLLGATTRYENTQAGISTQYPQSWLLDTDGDYVFRVRDTGYLGFQTLIQVSIQTVGTDASQRNLLDNLSLRRSQTLSNYTVLDTGPYDMPDESDAIFMSYSYVENQSSPFLKGIPIVVVGLDILTINRGQAIIITYRADEKSYQAQFPRFLYMLRTLEY